MLTTDEVDALLVELEPETRPAPETKPQRQPNIVATVIRRGVLIFAVTVIAFVVFGAVAFRALARAQPGRPPAALSVRA